MERFTERHMFVMRVDPVDSDSGPGERIANEAGILEEIMNNVGDVKKIVMGNGNLTARGKRHRVRRAAVLGAQQVHKRIAKLDDLRRRLESVEREMASATLAPLDDDSTASARDRVLRRLEDRSDADRAAAVHSAALSGNAVVVSAVHAERQVTPDLALLPAEAVDEAVEICGRRLKLTSASAADALESAIATIEANASGALRLLEEIGRYHERAFSDPEDVDEIMAEIEEEDDGS